MRCAFISLAGASRSKEDKSDFGRIMFDFRPLTATSRKKEREPDYFQGNPNLKFNG